MTPTERLVFKAAISPRCTIVAELKLYSPFGWTNPECGLDWERALGICEEVGSIVSVHTNPLWGGSLYHLEKVRRKTTLPILAKGFHDTIVDVRNAFDAGADYVLTVGWYPGDVRCWHECTSHHELANTAAQWAVWNARDPRTGEFDRPYLDEVISDRFGNLCQASGIKSAADVHPSVQAVLIGEGLYSS